MVTGNTTAPDHCYMYCISSHINSSLFFDNRRISHVACNSAGDTLDHRQEKPGGRGRKAAEPLEAGLLEIGPVQHNVFQGLMHVRRMRSERDMQEVPLCPQGPQSQFLHRT